MPGSGLGLSIVRQVAERHSGTVEAADAPTGGARLLLRLPGAATPVPGLDPGRDARALVAVLLAAATLAACSGVPPRPDVPRARQHDDRRSGGRRLEPLRRPHRRHGQPPRRRSGARRTTAPPTHPAAPSPRCAKGGAAYDVSYLWFDGGLDAALDAMGATGAQLEPVDVAGAEAARLVVDPSKTGVLVTGFVQTDGLVQSVNAAQLAPYDRNQVVATTRPCWASSPKRGDRRIPQRGSPLAQ